MSKKLGRLEFGNPLHIAQRKARKPRQKALPLEIDDEILDCIKFKVCIKCVKNVQKGYMPPPKLVANVCVDCREKFVKMSQKLELIGATIDVEHP